MILLMFKLAASILALVGSIASGGVGAQTVLLRAGEVVATDELVSGLSLDGVTLKSGVGERTLSIDRVDEVGGDLESEWEKIEFAADSLWRARVRIERGDLASAETILEALLPTVGATRGESSVVLWTGLMRCRVERGAIAGAIDAFLQYRERRSDAPGPEASMFRSAMSPRLGAALIDPATMLCPSLPPIYVATPAVVAAARATTEAVGGESGLAVLYRMSMAHEVSAGVVVFPPATGGDGVVLVRDIVKSRCGTAEERATARAALRDRLGREQPGWIEAWSRCAIGRSLLLEGDEDSRLLGIAELLKVPAILSDEVPYLTGVALAEAAVALADGGDVASAIRLRAEIAENLPDHPVLDWPKLKVLSMSRVQPPVSEAGSSLPGETR